MVRDARPYALDVAQMSGRRILVVDDHLGFRATARRLLEADGWQVVGEAADGATAIEAAVTLRPDLVLLDIGLPDVDGFVVAERLVAAGIANVVLVSSRERDAYAERLGSSVALAFIAKGDLDGANLRGLLRQGRGAG
jgi:DNA-binding NarL/FixJ family response regulator